MGREATGYGIETWGCDKPQKGEDAGSLQGGSDKAEKSCEQGEVLNKTGQSI